MTLPSAADPTAPSASFVAPALTDELRNSRFLRACRGEANDRPPLWLLRQAGRYMHEYRAVKAQAPDFLSFCKRPELCSQVTLDAQRIWGLDAAILFADLPPILECLGFDVSYPTGGPKIANPLRDPQTVAGMQVVDPAQSMAFVPETVQLVRAGLPADIPLIGFSGAPFTLAAYAIEGGGSKRFMVAKQFMAEHESAWHRFQEHLVTAVVSYAQQQVSAGCQAFQLFDSWVGQLSRTDFNRFVLPHLKQLTGALQKLGVPVIYFGLHTEHLLPSLQGLPIQVVGCDWTMSLDAVWQSGFAGAQGHLDPLVLTTNEAVVRREVTAMLEAHASKPGWICNVGHGLVPETKRELVQLMVELVQGWPGR